MCSISYFVHVGSPLSNGVVTKTRFQTAEAFGENLTCIGIPVLLCTFCIKTLPLYTLKLVYMFSTLFSIHFLRCWQGEFVKRSRASLVHDHFLYSCDLNVWLRGDICLEKLDASHFKGLKGYRQLDGLKKKFVAQFSSWWFIRLWKLPNYLATVQSIPH